VLTALLEKPPGRATVPRGRPVTGKAKVPQQDCISLELALGNGASSVRLPVRYPPDDPPVAAPSSLPVALDGRTRQLGALAIAAVASPVIGAVR